MLFLRHVLFLYDCRTLLYDCVTVPCYSMNVCYYYITVYCYYITAKSCCLLIYNITAYFDHIVLKCEHMNITLILYLNISQCSTTGGVCPDTAQAILANDDIMMASGRVTNGITRITYKRSLTTGESCSIYRCIVGVTACICTYSQW